MYSDLLYGGKQLAEVAGYDTAFTRLVLCRRRDDSGSLVRESGIPDHVKFDSRGQRVVPADRATSFAKMFRNVKESQGVTGEEFEKAREAYRANREEEWESFLAYKASRRRRNR